MQAKWIRVLSGTLLVGLVVVAPVATQAITGVLCIKTTGKGTNKVRNPTCAPTEVQVGTFDTTAPQASLGVQDISVRASTPSAVSIPHAAPNIASAVSFGTGSEQYDTASFHDESVNPQSFTVTVPGKYLVYGWATFLASSGGTSRAVRLGLNSSSNLAASSGPVNSSGVPINVSVSTHVDLAAGDVVTFEVGQDTGAPLNAFATFGMVKVP
jgi:hypothetical protein